MCACVRQIQVPKLYFSAATLFYIRRICKKVASFYYTNVVISHENILATGCLKQFATNEIQLY